MDAPSLAWLASRSGLVTARQLEQIQRWLDADWEAHDIDRDAVRLIARLVKTMTTHSALDEAEAALSAGGRDGG